MRRLEGQVVLTHAQAAAAAAALSPCSQRCLLLSVNLTRLTAFNTNRKLKLKLKLETERN